MDVREYDPADLPETLKQVSEVIGFELTLKIVERWGGQRFYIPKHVVLTSDLVEVIGIEAALKLSWQLGEWQFEVPTCAQMQRVARNRAIRKDAAAGMSRNAMSQKYGLALRALRQIINQPEKPRKAGS